MKRTILYNNYSEVSGLTVLEVANKYGTFCEEVICAPEDEDIKNHWDGFKFCEYKIDLRIKRAKIDILQERIKGMKELYNTCAQSQYSMTSDEVDYTLKLMNKQIRIKETELAKLRYEYKEAKKNYPAYVEYILNARRKARNTKQEEESNEN